MMAVPCVALAVGCALGERAGGRPAAHAVVAARVEATEKPSRTIAIDINGTPLDTDTPPLVVDGRVLFPLRDVFDALGITVTRAGSAITARLPTGSVRFFVGSARATVDGRNVRFEAATIDRNGTTYAPLQLLVDAFGAQASYDQRTAHVDIVSSYLGRTSVTEQQRAGGGTDVQGVVSAIDLDSSPPSLTVVRGGTSRTISVTSDARIWTEDVTIHSQLKGELGGVRVGDAVHAILAANGHVVSVFDFYRSTSGTVTAVAPAAIVLENGRVVTPTGSTQIALNSATAHLADLRVGDFVTVRSNPESGELRDISASRTLALQATPAASAAATGSPAAVTATIADVALSTSRPLRAGEDVDVLLHGTPGGRASFSIGDYLTNLPMQEHGNGFYTGRFTIPDRFNVTQVPIYGYLSAGGSDAPRAQAPQTLSAATIPPAIGEVAPPAGQVVNNSRPSIFATYSAPTEIAINQSSVSLGVNGHDATSASTRGGGFITYSPGVDLPDGPVTVVVRVSDAAGNTTTKSWTFTIKTR